MRRSLLPFAFILLAGSWTSTDARAATDKLIWGPPTLPDGASAFPLYRQLGVDFVQAQVAWDAVAPRRPADARDPADPAYRWPRYVDEIVAGAQQSDIRVALLARGTPRWANDGRPPAFAPRRPDDYADFLVALTRRYPGVRHWMIWGEPTKPRNFRPMPADSPTGPRRYARLLDVAYSALKTQSPANVVIGGMTWTAGAVRPGSFVRWMRLPNGKPPRMDLYGHNPFSVRFPRLDRRPYEPGLRDLSDIDTLHRDLARAYRGDRVPRLWLSEFTISSDKSNRAFPFSVSRREQAQWLRAAYRLVNEVSYVAGLGWFRLLDDPAAKEGGLTTGLMTHIGRRKPAFAAYADAP